MGEVIFIPIEIDVNTKIINITNPTRVVTIQELVDAVRAFEDDLFNMHYPKVIDAVGKADLGSGVSTGIVVSLNPAWQIRFFGGSGYTTIKGGTIVGGVGDEPVCATGSAGDLTVLQNPVNAVITSGSGASPADIADAVWDESPSEHTAPNTFGANLDGKVSDLVLDEIVEGTFTTRDVLRLCAAVLLGESAGGGTATVSFRDTGDTKNRIEATVDVNGNRTAVTLDAT